MKKYFAIVALVALIATVAYAAITNMAWDANTEPDLAGYKMYQSTTGATGPWVLIRTIPKGTLVAASNDLPDGTYHWTLTAFDTAGNESGYSNIIFRTIDSIAPAAPKNFRFSVP